MAIPLGPVRAQVFSALRVAKDEILAKDEVQAESVDAAEPEAPTSHRPLVSTKSRESDRRLRTGQVRRQLDQTLNRETAIWSGTPLTTQQLADVPTEAREIGQGGKGQGPGVGGKGQAPGVGGKGAAAPGSGGKGGVFNDQGRDLANSTLASMKPPALLNTYAKEKAQVKSDLQQLGLLKPGTARVHIDDSEIFHGGAVTRAAVGHTSLAEGAETSLNISGVPEEFALARRSPEQQARTTNMIPRYIQSKSGELTGDQRATLIADQMESTLLDKGDAVGHARSQLPKDGRDSFMNMSWGQSQERLLGTAAAHMLAAPKGSVSHAEVTKLLGHEPKADPRADGGTDLDEKEFQKVHSYLADKLDPIVNSSEQKARMTTARNALSKDLAAGRKEGLLVFASAGNEGASAVRHGDANRSKATAEGTPGLMLVGATDIGQAGTADDKVADFSAHGNITLSAAGVDIPVGAGGPDATGSRSTFNQAGTSFASPIALEAAYVADAVNPDLSVDQIAELLVDPRAVHDIKGTKLDGAGQVDHFAVALLAKNPKLTRAQIDQASTVLHSNPSAAQVAALKTSLGLD